MAALAHALITSRRSVLPKRLAEPRRDAQLLLAAAATPDHGERRLWHFVIVPTARRALLADMFKAALLDHGTQAMAAARERAHRALLSMLAVAKPGPAQPVLPRPAHLVPLGAPLQNLLRLLARAMGYGARLRTLVART